MTTGPRPYPATAAITGQAEVASAAGAAEVRKKVPRVADHELVRCIGQGSYGEVWLGRNALGDWRAIKLIYRRNFEHDRPFEREFEGIRKFDPISRQHPSQLQVLHVGRNDVEGCFYYIMELADAVEPPQESAPDAGPGPGQGADRLPGGRISGTAPVSPAAPGGTAGRSRCVQPDTYTPRTLKHELYRRERLPVDECLRIGLSLTTALEHLHDHGLVHRDIKPSNIIFVNGVPKLADIGLVASMDATMSFVGTSGFLPPEGPGTPQADLFSLGKVLYEMAMGRDRQDFPKLPANLGRIENPARLLELNAIILRACHSDPRNRYQRASEMAADLLLMQRGQSVRRLRAVERRLALITKAGLVIAGMLVVAAGLYWNTAREGRNTAHELYVADINRAFQAWEEGNVRLSRELLERHRKRQPEVLGFEWRLLARLCAESDSQFTLRGHNRTVWSLAFTPDDQTLATGSGDSTIKLWDTASGRLTQTLKGHTGFVHAVAFSPDGTLLASGSRDFNIKLWHRSSYTELATLAGHTDAVRTVAFSPDNRFLVSGGEDKTLRWWNLETQKEVLCAPAGLNVEQIAFAPDGRFAVCGSDIKIYIWNAVTRRKEQELELHRAQVLTVAYSSDGRVLASGSCDGTIRLWDTAADAEVAILGRGAPVRCVAFMPGDEFLAAGTEDGLVRLWDLARHEVAGTLRGHGANIRTLAFSRAGRWLASGDEDALAKLWHLSPFPGYENALLHAGLVNGLAFSPDGRMLASTDPNVDELRVWDPGSKQLLASTRTEPAAVWSVAFSPDSQALATGGTDGSVRIWNPANLSERLRLKGHTGGVDAVAFSADNRLIASAARDSTARIWDRASGGQLGVLSCGGAVRAVCFAPDSETLASGGIDGVIRLWNTRSVQRHRTLAEHQGEIRALAFSPDGKRLAAGGGNRSLQVWDLGRGTLLATLPGHSAMISSLAWSADGTTLASSSWDSTVKLWNLRMMREVGTLKAHLSQVTQVAFAPADDTLASASGDGTVRLWRAGARNQLKP